MTTRIDGRRIDAATVKAMTNCRLKKCRERLAEALAIAETEIDARMGKGGGGLV